MHSDFLTKSRDNARELSYELRHDSSRDLELRRKIVGLSLVSIGCMGLISLYQMGMIRHLPEPPLPMFDADKVDASPDAYEKLSAPDASLGLASYSVTMAMACMEGPDRAKTHPWLPLLMTGKVFVDTVQAGKLTIDQWTKHRAFCFWCLVAAGATFATLPLALTEARSAIRHLPEYD